MEKVEFHPGQESTLRHPWWWIGGSLLIGLVFIVFRIWGVWFPDIRPPDDAPLFLVHAAPFAAAFSFWISSWSPETIVRLFRMTERWLGVVGAWARVVLTLACGFFGFCLVAALTVLEEPGDEGWPTVAVLGVYTLATILGMQALGSDLRIGVVALQSRIRAAAVARWTRTVQFGVVLVCLVAVAWTADWIGGAVMTLGVTLAAALIGYHRRQLARLDAAIDEFLGLLDAVRSAGLDVHRASRDEWVLGVFAALRSLQLGLGARPRSLAPVISSRSLVLLCRIADAKATGREYLGMTYLKGSQARAGEAVLWLAGEDVALGAAQVADALIQQVAPRSSPVDYRRGVEVRQIMEKSALPVTSMTPVRARRSAASPRTPARRR